MKTPGLSVSIVIPNFNGRDLLRKNLPSVIKAYKNNKNKIIEVVVVDDASTDDSVKFLKENFKEVVIIQHKINRRFPASVNTGARSAKGDLICLLNTDVEPAKDFLEKALPHFKDRSVFAVSLHEEGYGWAKGIFENGFVIHSPGKENSKTRETFWVNGGSGVFRRSMWMKLKGMDEKLFSPFYWEDLDLGYSGLKRGWKLLWESQSNVIHIHESTNKRFKKTYRARIQERNQLLFIWKNITSPVLFKKHLRGLTRRVIRHPGYIRIIVMALSKYRSVIKKRKVEKKESKVSDESIFAKFQNA